MEEDTGEDSRAEFTLDEIERRILEFLDARGASFLKELSKHLVLPPSELLAKLERLVWNGIVTNDSFSVARYYMDLEKKNSPWLKYNTTPNMGRWYRTKGSIPIKQGQSIREYIHELLDRYGLVSKNIADCEKGVYRWSEMYTWLKNNEFTSGIKRGFYVSGLSGIQFARDRDIELIRMQDSPQQEESYVTLCSCDPANPYKDILANAVSSGPAVKIPRHHGLAAVFRNGRPVLLVKEYGSVFQPVDPDRNILEKAAASFVTAYQSRMLWTGRKNLFTEYWRETENGETIKIEDSPLYDKLQELGFDRGYSGMTLWRKSL